MRGGNESRVEVLARKRTLRVEGEVTSLHSAQLLEGAEERCALLLHYAGLEEVAAARRVKVTTTTTTTNTTAALCDAQPASPRSRGEVCAAKCGASPRLRLVTVRRQRSTKCASPEATTRTGLRRQHGRQGA